METHIVGNVVLHQVEMPDRGEYRYADDPQKLEDYEVEHLSKRGIVEAWYWYATGSYCGDGELVGKTTDGRWYSLNMSHCSCYGPTDTQDGDFFDTLEKLKEFPYRERLADMTPVLSEIK